MELSRRSSVRVRRASAISPGVSGSNRVGSAWVRSAAGAVRGLIAPLPAALRAAVGFGLDFTDLAAFTATFLDAMARTIHAFRSTAGVGRLIPHGASHGLSDSLARRFY